MLAHGVKVQKPKSMVPNSWQEMGRQAALAREKEYLGGFALQTSCLLYKQAHSL